jgi:hypothetical protein
MSVSKSEPTSNSRPRSLTEGLIEEGLILPDHPQPSSTTSSTTMSPHSFCQGSNLGSTLVHTLPSPSLSRTTSEDSYPYRKLGSQTLHSSLNYTVDFRDQFPPIPLVAKRLGSDTSDKSDRSDQSDQSDRSYFSIDLTEILWKIPGSHGKGKTLFVKK